MTKKILIFVPSFEIGGTIVSLYTLLKAIDKSRISVDIFARKREGPYLDKMENCSILDENYWLTETFSKKTCLNSFKIMIIKALKSVCRRLRINIKTFYIKMGCGQLKTEKYDAIVSYQENITHEIARYPAKRRIAWIHSDYSRFLELCGAKNENEVYANIDKVVCVSSYAKSVFDAVYPHYADKSMAIHNVIDAEGIRLKSLETDGLDSKFDTSSFTIVSAGRLDPVKQFEKIPFLAKQIMTHSDKPFKWYVIGGSRGFDDVEKEMQQHIEEFGLQDIVIRLLEKSNIYPYIAKADLYVCTSFSESFPLVVNEAKALCVPVVSNSFPSVKESITDGVDGYVVSMDAMPAKIAEMMQQNLEIKTTTVNNDGILKQIYQLFNA